MSTTRSHTLTNLDKRNLELTRELQNVDRMAQQLQKEKDVIVSSADEDVKQAKVCCTAFAEFHYLCQGVMVLLCVFSCYQFKDPCIVVSLVCESVWTVTF